MKCSILLVSLAVTIILSSCSQIPGYVPRYGARSGDHPGQTSELSQPLGTKLVYVHGLPYYKSLTGHMWWRVRENDVVRCDAPR